MTILEVGAARIESLEWLEESVDLTGWDHRARVGYGQDSLAVAGAGQDLQVPARDIVADSVVDEVFFTSRSMTVGSPSTGAQCRSVSTGIIFGVAATAAYAVSQHWSVQIPPPALYGGIGAALVIGAMAGLYPSMRAARLSPTEALRTV